MRKRKPSKNPVQNLEIPANLYRLTVGRAAEVHCEGLRQYLGRVLELEARTRYLSNRTAETVPEYYTERHSEYPHRIGVRVRRDLADGGKARARELGLTWTEYAGRAAYWEALGRLLESPG